MIPFWELFEKLQHAVNVRVEDLVVSRIDLVFAVKLDQTARGQTSCECLLRGVLYQMVV